MAGRDQSCSIHVENIGGIDQCTISFSGGVTVLEGRNATNRTSLLRAVTGVLGGDRTQLKSDADEARVEMTLGEETYTRYYAGGSRTATPEGRPYTEESTLVDLFVSLTEANPIRQTVESGGDLRDKLLTPLDTDKIQERIREVKTDRREIDDEISDIEREKSQLSELAERRVSIGENIEEIEAEIESATAKAQRYEVDEAEAEKAEELLEELEELRQTRTETQRKLEHQEDELSQLQDDLDQARSELMELEVPEQELEEVEQEIDSLKRQKREIESEMDDLTRVIEFNRELLASGDIPGSDVEESVVSGLDPSSETVECWTCGSRVQRQTLETRLDGLHDIVQKKRQERSELREEIDTLSERQQSLEQSAKRKRDLENRIEDIEGTIDHREGVREDLQSELDAVESEMAALEEQVEETEDLRDNDLVETYRRISELEYERGQLNQHLEMVTGEIEQIEQRVENLEQLRTRREELTDTIADLRSRIENTEQEFADRFNSHMEDLLAHLEFDNIERVWIERKVDSGNTTFDLHIVRAADDGSVYEDTVDTLSESEREVIGLVVALAGYLVYGLHEEIPFILLDSVESIDAIRINKLLDYFSDYASYILVALLPEDAAVVDHASNRVSEQTLVAGD